MMLLPLTILGGFTLGSFLVSFIYTFIRFSFPFSYQFKPKKAKWAVVTGASEGIGKEFSLQLAKKGYSVVLLARSVEKLNAVKKECETFKGVEGKVIPFDFSTSDEAAWSALETSLKELEIGVLVNNAAVSHDFPISFLDEDAKKKQMIMAVNCNSVMKITSIVLPQMVERKHGLVLNIGSMLGKLPSALLSVYSASKAFLRNWSVSIGAEVSKDRVHVEHINTLFVQTAMSKIRKPSLTAPTPKTFVKSVLDNCGITHDTTPYMPHAILNYILGLIPEELKVSQISAMHVDIRKRALRKKEREAKKL